MITGRCLCRAVRFELRAPPRLVCHCHCESCRRATSSPITTFAIVNRADLAFTGTAPAVHVSSPGVRRTFCGTCGSPIAYETERRPGDVDLYACTFDDPASLAPESHVFAAEQLPWLDVADHLPRYADAGGGEPVRVGPLTP